MSIQQEIKELFQQQVKEWPLLSKNFKGLETTKVRHFQFDGFSFNVQFNPSRIVSSAAKVDKQSIENRQCFLCSQNRPEEQRGLRYNDEYEILCNPFPIFREHFTIASKNHTPQAIGKDFHQMLDISRSLPEYMFFYNAPNCGASAPDHMHFQAGNRGLVPVEEEIITLKSHKGENIFKDKKLTLTAIDDGLRKFYLAESADKNAMEKIFKGIYQFSKSLKPDEDEPMLNILAWYNEAWQVMFFVRDKHRPWQYFAEGKDNILLSPASVDMGGTLITPLEKDFVNLQKTDITDIFKQVSLDEDAFKDGIAFMKRFLTGII